MKPERNIFKQDKDGNILFFKWSIFSKGVIVNDVKIQKELEKEIWENDKFLRSQFNDSGLIYYIFIYFMFPIIILIKLIPIILTIIILGSPLFFLLKYFVPLLPTIDSLLISVLFSIILLIRDYSNNIDKILNKINN